MIPVAGFAGRVVAVFGLGKSGLSTVRALQAGGAKVVAWDDGEAKRKEATEAGIALEDLSACDWSDIAALVLSPGVPLTHPEPHWSVKCAKAAGVEIIGDVELFDRTIRASSTGARIVAITGTNGKSTTTALIGHMVKRCGADAQVGGNIGTPVLELDPPKPNTVYVVEVSSYQIDLAPGFAPNVAILLNITPDHIDRHGSIEGYAAVKARIFANQTAADTAVIGVDDDYSSDICTVVSAARVQRVVPISVGKTLGRGIYVLDGQLYDSTGTQTQKAGDFRDLRTLAGAHNWQNAAAAYAAGRALGFPREKILASFESFPGLAHRMEIVAERDGVRYVNDSKATNADATSKALATYRDIYWILGGKSKEGGIETLTELFPRIRHAYLIGAASDEFARTLEGKVGYTRSQTLDRAVESAANDAEAAEGDLRVVLLSPACASFDQYPNFEVRGDVFRDLVLKHLSERASA
ncbi:UDP-N-acetylmuramoyl-L-alanine--D-glutamate ligase [Parvibaculum sedimenti]|uniref:UDP-N-acetylmuramoylalanine--D-glutamate ligase n=1 Tax=Parvibaculum sedimenti TaxID=2608632 RepID=A0A6N6VE08_9HYPH|nr:UDP-N-acetylmuramoyl-L-alanine--D-glutamate ligase [Parvibaculum sedimenti]KAB7738909.1 UDP-N-acetylmuramoyl-L-alanine--D-glutamate ligase [Parvibaculum sedimenti]